MSLEPFGRRELLAGTGGLFVCTLAGQKVFSDRKANVEGLASEVPVPPKVAAAERAGATSQTVLASNPVGTRREYWIQAESVRWAITPTQRDDWHNRGLGSHNGFTAYVYRLMTPGFAGYATKNPNIPGPTLTAEVGDVLVVHFRNADRKLDQAVTMHPQDRKSVG